MRFIYGLWNLNFLHVSYTVNCVGSAPLKFFFQGWGAIKMKIIEKKFVSLSILKREKQYLGYQKKQGAGFDPHKNMYNWGNQFTCL